MARARMIKPHFMFSRSMRAVSPMARLTFIQLWLVADDAGRLVAHPEALRSRLYPREPDARQLLPGWLQELEDQHCIERYTVDEIDYLRIVNWRKHQKIYHPTPSRLPAKPVVHRADSGATPESLGSESELPSGANGLTASRKISRAIHESPESLGKNPQNPAGPSLSPGFPSDSGGRSFLRRAAAVAHRALARAG